MAYTHDDIQMLIAQESSRFWKWNEEWLGKQNHWQPDYSNNGLRIIDCVSHRGTGKVRGDKHRWKVKVDKAAWRELGKRRRG